MPSALEASGATREPSEFATLTMDRQMTGLWTQRSPFRDADVPYLQSKFYAAGRFDSLIDGINREITARLTQARRAGTSVWNANTFAPINSFYSFSSVQNGIETIQLFADGSDGAVWNISNGKKINILSKSAGAGKARFAAAGSAMFICDGAEAKTYVCNKAGQWITQTMGIPVRNAIYGLTQPTVTAQSGSGVAWQNLSYLLNLSPPYATVTLDNATNTGSQTLVANTCGFAVPATDTVLGVQIAIKATCSVTDGSGNPVLIVGLMKAGVTLGQKQIALTVAGNNYSLGGPADSWGMNLTGADVNDPTFGVSLVAINARGSTVASTVVSANAVAMGVFTVTTPTATPGGTGSLQTVNGGWKYVQCYGGSSDGSCSNASPASASTGNFSGKLNVTVHVTASPESQVDMIRLFRTADGGFSFLEHPNSPFPNATQDILDTASDQALSALASAPIAFKNNPAPANLTAPAYHMQRIFGIVDNAVCWSGGPDTLVGNGYTAWPPLNIIPFPEKPVKLIPVTLTNGALLVITTKNIWAIMGTGTSSNPFYPVMYLKGVGALNYDAIDVIGATIYLFTSKSKFCSLDPSAGYTEVGFPIGDQLSGSVTTGAGSAATGALYDPNTTFVSWHEQGSGDTAIYLSDGAVGWFRFSPVASPESGYLWSPRAAILGGTSAVQSVETSSGITQLLIGPSSSGPIRFRDASVHGDWLSGDYQAFPAWDVKGNIVLCESGEIAEIAHIALKSKAVGARPTVGILLGEISSSTATPFDTLQITSNDPPILPPSTTYYSDRYSTMQNGICAKCDNFQLKVDYGAQLAADELLKFSVYGAKHAERKQQ